MEELKYTLIECIECGTVFKFKEGEAEYFKKMGFHTPKRCPMCRQKRREQG